MPNGREEVGHQVRPESREIVTGDATYCVCVCGYPGTGEVEGESDEESFSYYDFLVVCNGTIG